MCLSVGEFRVGTYEKTRGGITASVYEKKCLGCGLCVCSCAQKALYLEGVDCIRRMARG